MFLALASGILGFTLATDADSCGELPQPSMHVRLTLNSTAIGDAALLIEGTATEVWRREGLSLIWAPQTDNPTWDGIDLWIVVSHAPADFENSAAIGSVLFTQGVPRRLIRISMDAAVDWVRRALARRHGIARKRLDTFRISDIQPTVAQTVAYAVTHEIGHFLLGSPDHTSGGLMQSRLRTMVEMTQGVGAIHLDRASHHRLADRLAASAQCARP